jgi:nicotinamide-nucleotide amidase
MQKKANELVKRMQTEGLTLVLAESMTCGLAATKLSSCIGVSNVLLASLVCYTPKAKIQLLQVKHAVIQQYSCESHEVTRQMTGNLSKLVKANIYAAITGLASSDGSETSEKPVGTTFYAIRYKGKTHDYRKVFRGTPLEIKTKAAIHLYDLILKLIEKNENQ